MPHDILVLALANQRKRVAQPFRVYLK